MKCDKCKSDRIFSLNSKSSDMNNFTYMGAEGDGYCPDVEHICGGDYIFVTVCLECGKIQGDFPVHSEALEELGKAPTGPYYFYAGESESYGCKGYGGRPMVLVTITSKEYWDKDHYASDWHLSDELSNILPKGFAETMEGCFESKFSLQQTKDKLIAAGFIEDEKFGFFCKTHDPYI